MVEKSQDKEMDKSVAVGNVENNSEKIFFQNFTLSTENEWDMKTRDLDLVILICYNLF